jgi:hypothetical protein
VQPHKRPAASLRVKNDKISSRAAPHYKQQSVEPYRTDRKRGERLQMLVARRLHEILEAWASLRFRAKRASAKNDIDQGFFDMRRAGRDQKSFESLSIL